MRKPVVIIIGASGKIGTALSKALAKNYTVVGLDQYATNNVCECDLTSADSIKLAMRKIKFKHGSTIAVVIHLAAYFDFTGEDNPLYDSVNVEGTKNLLQVLQDFEVERFIYSSTMLVNKPTNPGNKINEKTPAKPSWAYPKSKYEAEKVIKSKHGKIPYTILRLAGLYDDETAVPTLSYQIARIYERELKSHLYAGDLMAGQSFIHQDDMIDLFQKVVDKRNELPKKNIILAGEENVMSYQELQNRISSLIFGDIEWKTINLPETIAKTGAWAEDKFEPVIPDIIDKGKKPFIKPFMIDLASDHYDLDISKAKKLLGWEPEHNIHDGLEKLVKNLKKNPLKWYEENAITPPDWIAAAKEKKKNPDKLRDVHEEKYRKEHRSNLWAHFLNIGLAFWLITSPFILGYESQAMTYSDMGSGVALAIFSYISLSWRFGLARWVCAFIGLWLLTAPLVFWAPTVASYLNGTIIGMLVMGLAVCTRPVPGVSALAAETGASIPKGWEFSPSGWFQRMPIIILAFVGFFISRYLTAYQLGHIDNIWDPFFAGSASDPQNGTEEIITSDVSKAWPVPDAGLGALTYALEILTGIIGSNKRWRTMPWLVMLFGIMIVPLGIISITFIIIQPIIIGTWCTLCLIAAAAMLIQIPYSLDELVATSEFLWRRKKQGRPLLRIFLFGDTEEGRDRKEEDNFSQPPSKIIKEMLSGGVTIPWNLALCALIGLWLMFTRITLGAEGGMANADHIIGSLVLTIVITALAESARAVRFLIMPFGLALLVTPFVYGADNLAISSSIICGLLLIILSYRKGRIVNNYGNWDRLIV